MELLIQNISMILIIVAVICTVTSIITELTKEIGILNRIPTAIQVVATSIILTLITYLAAASYYSWQMKWYMIFACVIVGILIGYITMYGWDSLINKFKNYYKKDLK